MTTLTKNAQTDVYIFISVTVFQEHIFGLSAVTDQLTNP